MFGSPNIRRSPTPEGTIPISKRSRKYTAWDVKAPGYESMNAMEAKFSGEHLANEIGPKVDSDHNPRRVHVARSDSTNGASDGGSVRYATNVP